MSVVIKKLKTMITMSVQKYSYALDEVSRTYWDIVQKDKKEALEYVSLQSATQTILVIQLMNNIRNL